MKLVKIISIAALMSASAASYAFWDNGNGNGWGNGNGNGNVSGERSGYGSGYSSGRIPI